jgi:hypothetical protein
MAGSGVGTRLRFITDAVVINKAVGGSDEGIWSRVEL